MTGILRRGVRRGATARTARFAVPAGRAAGAARPPAGAPTEA